MMVSRRSFLAGTPCIPIASAGCLSFSSEAKLRSRAGGPHPQPAFPADDRWDESPFAAGVFTDPDAAASLPIDDERLRTNYLNFDQNAEFLAVFSSTLDIDYANYCPAVDVTGEQVVFELPIGDWPSDREPPHENWIVLTLWERNGNDPPAYATVKIIHPDDTSDGDTCPVGSQQTDGDPR